MSKVNNLVINNENFDVSPRDTENNVTAGVLYAEETGLENISVGARNTSGFGAFLSTETTSDYGGKLNFDGTIDIVADYTDDTNNMVTVKGAGLNVEGPVSIDSTKGLTLKGTSTYATVKKAGNNIIALDANSGSSVRVTGIDTPKIDNDAVNKKYVDDLSSVYVNKNGDIMTGDLEFNGGSIIIKESDAEEGVTFYTEGYEGTSYDGGNIDSPVLSFYGTAGDEPVILRGAADPVSSRDAASKNYVDTRIYQGVKTDPPSDTTMLWIVTDDSTETGGSNSGGTPNALPLAGGTMTGNINMGNNRILGLPTTPSDANEAVSKAYVDSVVGTGGTGGGGIAQAFFTSADGIEPTTNYGLLWIDLSANGGLKYYNGSKWVHVPVGWAT